MQQASIQDRKKTEDCYCGLLRFMFLEVIQPAVKLNVVLGGG